MKKPYTPVNIGLQKAGQPGGEWRRLVQWTLCSRVGGGVAPAALPQLLQPEPQPAGSFVIACSLRDPLRRGRRLSNAFTARRLMSAGMNTQTQ